MANFAGVVTKSLETTPKDAKFRSARVLVDTMGDFPDLCSLIGKRVRVVVEDEPACYDPTHGGLYVDCRDNPPMPDPFPVNCSPIPGVSYVRLSVTCSAPEPKDAVIEDVTSFWDGGCRRYRVKPEPEPEAADEPKPETWHDRPGTL